MHPRAIVGPPGTTPHLNPQNGMPQLRRSLIGRSHARVANPMLQFGAGAPVEVPSSSIAVDPPPIQANPERLGGIRMGLWKRNPGQTTGSINGRPLNPACHESIVSVGAALPTLDPVQTYGAGQPPPMPNPLETGGFPGVHPITGMPRLRERLGRVMPG